MQPGADSHDLCGRDQHGSLATRIRPTTASRRPIRIPRHNNRDHPITESHHSHPRSTNMGDIAPPSKPRIPALLRAGCRTLTVTIVVLRCVLLAGSRTGCGSQMSLGVVGDIGVVLSMGLWARSGRVLPGLLGEGGGVSLVPPVNTSTTTACSIWSTWQWDS